MGNFLHRTLFNRITGFLLAFLVTVILAAVEFSSAQAAEMEVSPSPVNIEPAVVVDTELPLPDSTDQPESADIDTTPADDQAVIDGMDGTDGFAGEPHDSGQSLPLTEPEAASADEISSPDQESAGLVEQVPELPSESSVAAPVTADTKGSFRILGTDVARGSTARLSWEPSDNFMGISAPTSVLVANGVNPGPTLCLTAAVHGDELNGIEIVRDVFYGLNPNNLSGVVMAVPIVNLQGFRRGQRYLPDRRDLNRYFPGNPKGSAASRIAHSLFHEVIRHCDFLVDLHTGSFRRTNLAQLRVDLTSESVAELARKMGDIAIVHSVGSPGTLRRNAVEQGIPAVTLELGEPHFINGEAIVQGTRSIRTLIASLGMEKIPGHRETRSGPEFMNTRWVRTIEGGILISRVRLGDNVKKGHVLGTVTDPITNVRHEVVSTYNGKVIGMALDQVMYPGYAAFHIGLRRSTRKTLEDDLADEPGTYMGEAAPADTTINAELQAEREFDVPFFDELSTDPETPTSQDIED